MSNTIINYASMTKDELITYCKEHNIKGYSEKKKEQIIDIINKDKDKDKDKGKDKNGQHQYLITKKKIQLDSELLHTKYNMCDLFAGTGAFSYAFINTSNVNVVFANDMVEQSQEIYDMNYEHKLRLKNINDIKVEEIPKHDILTGGFPCQPFSISGKQLGFQDKRANVFWKILEILEYHKPECIVLENVKNLVSHDDNKTFKIIIDNLTKKGYYLKYKVLNTSEITIVPQHRERIYIVGFRSKELYDKFSLDFDKQKKDKITKYLETTVPDKYYYDSSSKIWNSLAESVIKEDTIYQYRRVYVRENKNKECPTLTANMGMGGHNVPIIKDTKGIRKLTPRECFNLQGFPSTYKLPKIGDSHLYKLAGNAVSVPVVKLIADRIMLLLQKKLIHKNISSNLPSNTFSQ
jgi:DNA (cytosine-5)-methyltransferase 1